MISRLALAAPSAALLPAEVAPGALAAAADQGQAEHVDGLKAAVQGAQSADSSAAAATAAAEAAARSAVTRQGERDEKAFTTFKMLMAFEPRCLISFDAKHPDRPDDGGFHRWRMRLPHYPKPWAAGST